MNPIRVALVEDDEVIRTITFEYLSRQPELQAVICANSAEDFLAQLADAILPQVILLDVGLPGMSGLEAIPKILTKAPEANIIIQTILDDTDVIYQALSLGAIGYVLKSTLLAGLKEAILEVMQGGTPFSRSVSRKVLAHFKPTPQLQPNLLSPREKQVLSALVDGLTAKQAASRLGVGLESVQTYIKGIYTKLQVRSRSELLVRVLRGNA